MSKLQHSVKPTLPAHIKKEQKKQIRLKRETVRIRGKRIATKFNPRISKAFLNKREGDIQPITSNEEEEKYVPNNHIVNAGTAPEINMNPGRYYSYDTTNHSIIFRPRTSADDDYYSIDALLGKHSLLIIE
jgi:hypothetical protein